MRFEWDAAKDRANQAKHGDIDFETAARVFDDPDMLLSRDRVVDNEQRWHAIGAVMTAVLLVVHICRDEGDNGEETIRIISAREASKRERGIYLQQADR